MSENEKPKLDLDTLAERAKEVLLRDGYHGAILFVETTLQTLAVELSEMGESHDERLNRMFLSGFALAKVADIGILQQVFFITEAWLAVVEENKPFIEPTKDPKRKEVLTLSQMDVPENKTVTRIYEMKRNKKGNLTQVIRRPQLEGDSAKSVLLEAFVMGFLGMTGKTND